MNLSVENKEFYVEKIQILGISASSLCLIGDTQFVRLSSSFDTPPESVVYGPLVPLSPKG